MANKTYIYCGSNDMSIMKLCLSTLMLSQFKMVTLLLGHPVVQNQREHHIILTEYEAVHPTAVSENYIYQECWLFEQMTKSVM